MQVDSLCVVDRLSGVLNRHRGQRFNPYASGYKNNVFGEKGMPTNMQFFSGCFATYYELQQILSKTSSVLAIQLRSSPG